MADAVTSQILFESGKRLVVKLTNLSDGTGESAVKKVDVSEAGCSAVSVDRIQFDCAGMSASLLWDATANVTAAVLAGTGVLDFRSFGGLRNNAGDGKSGDILLSTNGHGAGDSYTIILEMTKQF